MNLYPYEVSNRPISKPFFAKQSHEVPCFQGPMPVGFTTSICGVKIWGVKIA